VDENRLQQVLFNLVGNAIKFTEQGHIKIKAIEKEGMVQVSVEDTGIGIAADKKESIFQAFEQGDGSASRIYAGTGLGLNISKQLIELHGGQIWVESTLGTGATFFFTLPISTEKAVASKPASFVSKVVPAPIELNETIEPIINSQNDAINVLVVDDEPINQQVLKNHLSGKQYNLTQTMNGEEALKEIASNKLFDLVLLDVMMPHMSGYEVCQKIREKYLPSQLPIIMVTAKNQVEDLVEGLSYGANDYLTKPFSKNEFMARVKTQLNLHRINSVTSKFIPNEFLRSLGRENITEVLLGDHTSKEVTVLFSDIRAYTTLSENMSPEENFKFVQKYNGQMGPIIQANNGFVNQYLGDGIMSIFTESPTDSLRAAIDMQQQINSYNKQRIQENREPIKVGMGMHTGSLIMGIIGDVKRMDAATISDSVNTASRIENLTKYYGTSILLSGVTLEQITAPEAFHFRYLGQVQVKGKQNAVKIYECFDGEIPEMKNLKLATLPLFEEGIQHYFNQSFTQAAMAFDAVLKQNPKDNTAQLFLEKAGRLITSGVDDDWTGIEMMENK